jgi:hypothetical protein
MMSNTYYKHSEEKPADTSCASTVEPPTTSLRLLFEGLEFEWFQVTPQLIADISLEIFQRKLANHFEVSEDELIVQDHFGLIKSTVDLRRSLMSTNPRIAITRWLEEPRIPTAPTDPPKSFCVRLSKRSRLEKFGFGIVDSMDDSRLIVSEKLPHSALADKDIEIGDEIVGVNGQTSISAMRRELSTALTVVLQIEKSFLSYPRWALCYCRNITKYDNITNRLYDQLPLEFLVSAGARFGRG